MLKKRLFMTMVCFALVASSLAATRLANVRWSWDVSGSHIAGYRVQANGLDEDGWTLLSSNSSSYTFEDVDVSKENTFYFEYSMDGKVWSDPVSRVLPPQNISNANELKIGDASGLESGSSSLVSYEWINTGENDYLYKIRLDDGPWFIVDENTKKASFVVPSSESSNEDHVFQLKCSKDGENWSHRITSSDPSRRYDEEYMADEGWVFKLDGSAQWPFLAAFLVPSNNSVVFYDSERLNTSVNVGLGGAYETKSGNSFGFRLQYIFTPTGKEIPFQTISMEFSYSRLLFATAKRNSFQMWMDLGLGPALCMYENIGSFGFTAKVGLSARIGIGDSFFICPSFDVNGVFEPSFNSQNDFLVGSTVYLTLPLRLGFMVSYKEVSD